MALELVPVDHGLYPAGHFFVWVVTNLLDHEVFQGLKLQWNSTRFVSMTPVSSFIIISANGEEPCTRPLSPVQSPTRPLKRLPCQIRMSIMNHGFVIPWSFFFSLTWIFLKKTRHILGGFCWLSCHAWSRTTCPFVMARATTFWVLSTTCLAWASLPLVHEAATLQQRFWNAWSTGILSWKSMKVL